MTYVEYDQKIPVYSNINRNVEALLKEDRLHLSSYMVLVDKLSAHFRLVKTIQKLKHLFTQESHKKHSENLLKALMSIEIGIFEFVDKLEKPYAYLMSPYFKHKSGKKYANIPEISEECGYIQIEGTGMDALNLSEKYAKYKLGLYNPVKRENIQTMYDLMRQYPNDDDLPF